MLDPDVDTGYVTCPACGFPMAGSNSRCPNCRWSRDREGQRSREFWWALLIFAGIFFATAVAIYIVASRLHVG